MKSLTARQITVKLFWDLRGASQILIPRYTPRDWWECDLWRLTKSGYTDEYEIKLSVSDFKADLSKSKRTFGGYNAETKKWIENYRVKHDELQQGKGPNRFWYVVRSDMPEVAIPTYAGLMIVDGRAIYTKIAAPKLHSKKWDGDRLSVMTTFYHRYWTHETASKEPEIDSYALDDTGREI